MGKLLQLHATVAICERCTQNSARTCSLARNAVFFGWESAAEAVVLARVISTASPVKEPTEK